MANTEKILIIEDDPNIVDLLKIHIGDLGLVLETAVDGRSGLALAEKGDYELIILDLMLPELDGLEVCKKIRETDKHTPILILSARSEELDKVLGLELGADDYLTKPFSIRELIARVKAILRRQEVNSEQEKTPVPEKALQIGELSIDVIKRKISIAGKPVDLTAKEFDLLLLFARHPGRAFTRNELLDRVWGYQFDGYDHTVNSHINRLRSKIEKDPANPVYIQTVWGVGYRFVEPQDIRL